MKYSYIRFLSKANIKGNRKSNTVIVLMCLLVIACTVISCFTAVTGQALNEYKEDYRARALELDPWLLPLTDDAISSIKNVEHVSSVDDIAGLPGFNLFDISDIYRDEDKFDEVDKKIKDKVSAVYVCGLVGEEKKRMVAGKNLEDSPVFSCIVPSLFYPFLEDHNIKYENLDYIDGTTLIGKTITVKGYNGNVSVTYNYSEDDASGNDDAALPSPEYKLKIVGTYFCSPTTSGSFEDILVSRETDLKMTEMALESAGVNLSSKDSRLANWWNDSSLHSYYVVADDFDNLPYIFNEISRMGYAIANSPEQLINDGTVLMANLFGTVGVFLIVALFILAVITLVQSSVTSVNERKSYIGLLKAIGYKNRQVFVCMCIEQLSLTLKGFLIGGTLSAALVALTNYIFIHGAYQTLVYIIDWRLFLFFICISLALSIIIPLICQVILIKKLTDIQPINVMN